MRTSDLRSLSAFLLCISILGFMSPYTGNFTAFFVFVLIISVLLFLKSMTDEER